SDCHTTPFHMFSPPKMIRRDEVASRLNGFMASQSGTPQSFVKNPFPNILRFVAGDFVAKTINLLTFVYLARALGVETYGVLELAIAILTYFLKTADGGLEMWAMRGAARGVDMNHLIGRVVPLRGLLAVLSFGALLALLPVFPQYESLRMLLVIFGFTALVEGLSLRWVFMGQERLAGVAIGLVVGQIVFAMGVFALVDGPEGIILVAVLRLAGDFVMAGYFFWLFTQMHGRKKVVFTLKGGAVIFREAFPLGVTHFLGLASYNLDT